MATNIRKKAIDGEALKDIIITDGGKEKIDIEETSSKEVAINDSAIINVKSNVFGSLIYIDKKSQEEIRWSTCGEIQQLSMRMLRDMKANSIAFFKNQWIIIIGFADDNSSKYTVGDIYKSLFVSQYYKELIEPSDFKKICSWDEEEIAQKVALMSEGARVNLAIALNEYIQKGILDSIKRIKAFEKALGCELKIPE